HEQVLVHARFRGVSVAEGNVDRPVPADDRMGALILVARARIGLAAEVGAEIRVRPTDLDPRRPRRAAVGRLAEVDRAVATHAFTRVEVEPRPRRVDVVRLRARTVRVRDDELLVVRDVRVVVLGDDAGRVDQELLERLYDGGVV